MLPQVHDVLEGKGFSVSADVSGETSHLLH
jgi:hypothetical protein